MRVAHTLLSIQIHKTKRRCVLLQFRSIVRSPLHYLRFNYLLILPAASLPRDYPPLPCFVLKARARLIRFIKIYIFFSNIIQMFCSPLFFALSIRHKKSASEYYPSE